MTAQFKSAQQLSTIIFALLFFDIYGSNNISVNIIPQPLKLEVNESTFSFNKHTQIIIDSDDPKIEKIANYFVEQFNSVSGFSLKVKNSFDKKIVNNALILTNKNLDSFLGDEGYSLISNKERVLLTGTPNGLFYGIQTLFQLLPIEIYKSKIIKNIEWQIPGVKIEDKPRFKWRGMHLDVGRHMFPVSFIKKYIDFIALHKMNTFHWHLTDDQGWRIEIKKYPLLTKIGAFRKGTQIGKSNQSDNKKYGGFYTQEEIVEVVKYAEERFITIVPEIEMPGHSIAALASYPSLSCNGTVLEVEKKWGIFDDIYCAGNDSVFTFIENVLNEVINIFPSKYIHIGGDEAPKTRWEKCPKCQNRIKQEGLKDEHELQSYFITRIEKYLNSKGRQIIGWDEILEGGLAPNAAVMSWRGIEGGISAAKLKHNVVMSPTDFCYFDYYAGLPENEPLAIGGFLTLDKVYSYEPIPDELTLDEQKYIMGVQANQWTEYISTTELAEYMTLPRLCALSEVAWSSKENRNLEKFLDRMSIHYGRLYFLDINFRMPGFKGLKLNNVFINETTVEIKSKQKNTEVRYTIDGTEPTQNSLLYTAPFKVNETTFLRIIEITSFGESNSIYEANYIKEKPRKSLSITSDNKGLNFDFFEFTKKITSTNDLQKILPSIKGEVNSFVFPFEEEKLPEQFGLIFNGYIKISEEDVYNFSVSSNDGSRLYIADKLVVNNDGLHGEYEKEGEIALQAGYHKIRLLYFQAGGGKSLKVFINNSKKNKEEISSNILSH